MLEVNVYCLYAIITLAAGLFVSLWRIDDWEGFSLGCAGCLGQLLRDLHEQSAYVVRGLGGRLQIQDVVLLGVLRRLLRLHFALGLQVALVAGEGDHHVRVAAALQLLDRQ